MAYQFFDCKMVDIKDENDVVKRFFIKVPDEIPFKHKAGQFVMLDLPIESKVTTRSYSIASAPSDDHVFELLIVINPQGIGTPYLFKNVVTGSTVRVSRVLGKFLLPDPIDADL